MIDERTEELAAAYALGALEPGEIPGFEAQLIRDPELRGLGGRSARRQRAGGRWSAPDRAVRSAAGARHRRHGRARAGKSGAGRGWQRSLPWALAAGLAAVCVIFGLQVHSMGTQLEARQQRIDELDHMAEALRAERADLKQAVAIAGSRVTALPTCASAGVAQPTANERRSEAP